MGWIASRCRFQAKAEADDVRNTSGILEAADFAILVMFLSGLAVCYGIWRGRRASMIRAVPADYRRTAIPAAVGMLLLLVSGFLIVVSGGSVVALIIVGGLGCAALGMGLGSRRPK